MDKDTIKETLSGYRPEIYDADDPHIEEALKLAKADPELRQHLEEECAFDRDFSVALKSIPVNYEGIEDLLVSTHEIKSEKIVTFTRRRVVPIVLASVALIMLSGVLINYFFFPKSVVFPELKVASSNDFRKHMAYFATQRFNLEKTTSDWAVAHDWLAQRNAPVYNAPPEHLTKLKGMGCREIDWNGTKVSLICFLNGKEELVHLFIVNKASLTSADLTKLALIERHHELETQGWSDEEFVYVLVGSEKKVSLKGLL